MLFKVYGEQKKELDEIAFRVCGRGKEEDDGVGDIIRSVRLRGACAVLLYV